MSEPFLTLGDLEALEAAVVHSHREPVIIFKHSPACGISAQAHQNLSGWLAGGRVSSPAYLVSVREQRALSSAISARFGIRHESPQVLILHGGAVRWHGSHWHVNPREVEAAVETLLAPFGR